MALAFTDYPYTSIDLQMSLMASGVVRRDCF